MSNAPEQSVVGRETNSQQSTAQPLTRNTLQGISETLIRPDAGDFVSMPLSGPNKPLGEIPSGYLAPQYSHLPTPQSPNNIGRYILEHSHAPESPMSHGPQFTQPFTLLSSVNVNLQNVITEANPNRSNPENQKYMTPENSPNTSSATPPRYINAATPRFQTPLRNISNPNDVWTPQASTSSVKLESPVLMSTSTPEPAPHITCPTSSASDQHSHSSQLSSPFMAKLAIGDRVSNLNASANSRSHSFSPDPRPAREDIFSPPMHVDISSITTPPTSPPRFRASTPALHKVVGGEMERIRLIMEEDRLAQVREAENRRPDYLKRTKRSLSEADPSALVEDEVTRERVREIAVGILETPHKGRRLKLFQETSEESFEESLMAGGYGRYRTADWVRQPQPLAIPSVRLAGPSNIVHILEEVETPLSGKEIKKRKRLAAFRSENSSNRLKPKLYPVELEGKGRVLVDIPNDEPIGPSLEATPIKKRGGNRRKKKGVEIIPKDQSSSIRLIRETVDKPNWPDAEFPWRLRTEEMIELAKAEEEERLRWIEKFLDRDTDEEDEDEEPRSPGNDNNEADQVPTSEWDSAYEVNADHSSLLKSHRMGMGKTVHLLSHPNMKDAQAQKKTNFWSDPGDARAALLAKKSIRALSYRQQRRKRELRNEEDSEVVCTCNGKDDGRELVQCDGCQMWYHLQCIGINSISELGKEEDPWFCRNCVTTSPSPEPDIAPYREPTFVPTDTELSIKSYDAPFFQPSLQDFTTWDSSGVPKTPTRSTRHVHSDSDPGLSSSPSWIESSRPGPSTPLQHAHDPRVYAISTPGPYDGFHSIHDESPFDPTSTPSRGIKFHAPFATPKYNIWSTRANGSFHTPSKPSGHPSFSRISGGPFVSGLDDGGGQNGGSSYDTFPRINAYDDSPIRRSFPNEGSSGRRLLDLPRAMGPFEASSLEDSPIMRSKGKERLNGRDS